MKSLTGTQAGKVFWGMAKQAMPVPKGQAIRAIQCCESCVDCAGSKIDFPT
jgi:hypothetical protein